MSAVQRTHANHSRLRFWIAVALCAAGGLAAAIFHEAVLDTALSSERTGGGVVVTAVILFSWYLGSQLVLAPSGTISVILGALVIGPSAGLLYFIAMVFAGAAVHLLAQSGPGEAERLIRKLLPQRSWRRLARRSLRRIRQAPIAATAALRLVPVLPSAGCALTLAAAGTPVRSAVLGTLAAGWVRPLAFAVFSDQIWRAIQSPTVSAGTIAANPAVWISVLCILAPLAIVFVSDRLARSRA